MLTFTCDVSFLNTATPVKVGLTALKVDNRTLACARCDVGS
jgi:hypothetical protein